jgi:hypothetical protein
MKRWKSRRPSPTLLIACAALFVALGGTVTAATKIDGRTIRAKSLPGDRLQIGSVPGNRLKAKSIQGDRLVPGSVKGAQVDAASLGQVSNAAHAESADTAHHAQTAVAADHAADATTINGRAVGCPATAREFAGACWDLHPSAAALTAPEAATACADKGGELPHLLALMSFVGGPGIEPAVTGEWTGDVRVDSGGIYSVPILEANESLELEPPDEPHHFRCVTPLLS